MVINPRHENELDDIEEDVRGKECPDRDIEAVSKFKYFGSGPAGGSKQALLSSSPRQACHARSQYATHDEVGQSGHQQRAGEKVNEDEHDGQLDHGGECWRIGQRPGKGSEEKEEGKEIGEGGIRPMPGVFGLCTYAVRLVGAGCLERRRVWEGVTNVCDNRWI